MRILDRDRVLLVHVRSRSGKSGAKLPGLIPHGRHLAGDWHPVHVHIERGHEDANPGGRSGKEAFFVEVLFQGDHTPVGRRENEPFISWGGAFGVAEEELYE